MVKNVRELAEQDQRSFNWMAVSLLRVGLDVLPQGPSPKRKRFGNSGSGAPHAPTSTVAP